MRTIFIILFLIIVIDISAQTEYAKTIAGLVTNQNGVELSDVHVVSVKNGKGTITNEKGYFKIAIVAPDTLRFVYVGSKSKDVVINKTDDPIRVISILLEPSTVMLNEVEVSPYLSKDNMSYDELPKDAGEANRAYLREKAKNTDKTRFPTVGYNFAPAIFALVGTLFEKNEAKVDAEMQHKLRMMHKSLYEKGDTLFKNSIPIDSMKHPSREIFKR